MDNLIHDIKVATLATIVAQDISLEKDNLFFSDYKLNESLYELRTHKAIVRATLILKERDEPVTVITISKFLQSHNIPRTMQEQKELSDIFGASSLTKNTFLHYMDELNRNVLKRFNV